MVAPPMRFRITAILAATVFHAALLLLLVKGLTVSGFLPGPAPVTRAYNVPLAPPSPVAPPSSRSDEAAGKAAPEAPRARPRDVAAPPATLRLPAKPAPPASSKGDENRSGAGEAGTGSGGGGIGTGTGSGGSGDGAGAGLARKAEKIAGDIRSARDYPAGSRDQRLGRSVVIAVTVGADGRPLSCRIARPSGNAEADAITCRLAMQRFRFRPATNRNGEPVESVYGWEQRWFTP